MQKRKESKVSKKDFLTIHHGQEVENLSRTHTRYVMFWFFMDKVRNGNIKCSNLRKNMENLCLLYGLNQLYQDSSSCYESGYFAREVSFSALILEAMKLLNAQIRP